jgi:hypothetical protein
MSVKRPVVVAIAGDAGGAAAVGPVIEILRKDAHVEVSALAYRHASAAWSPRNVAFDALDERIDEAGVESLLLASGAKALLMGTSMNGIDLERIFTRVGRRLRLASVAVLDMWSNYSARFGAVAGVGEDVPDRVAIMDERARQAMLLEGFQPEQLVVTGHPAFDDVIEARRKFGSADRKKVRDALQVSMTEQLVLFASQPLTLAWGEDVTAPGHPGYTERTALDAVLSSLDRLVPRLASSMTLVVRPHPREEAPEVPPGAHSYRVLVSRAGTPREAAMSADAVLGMCTILLVESALLGIPTVSVQPGLRTNDALPFVPGLARVYREDDIDAALDAALRTGVKLDGGLAATVSTREQSHPARADTWDPSSGTAARRVAEIVYQLLGAGR